MKLNIFSVGILVFVGAMLTACGGGDGDANAPPGPPAALINLSGKAIAGSAVSGTVTAYDLNADGKNGPVLGTAQIDGDGAFSVSLPTVPTGGLRLVVSAGRYVSPANPSIIVSDTSLSALVTVVGSSGVSGVVITPLTTFADQRLINLLASAGSLSAAQTQADGFVKAIYGIFSDTALSALAPDFTATSGDAATLALVLGALEQLAIENGKTSNAIIHAMGEDIADGVLDGKTVGGGGIYYDTTTVAPTALGGSQFLNALTSYVNSPDRSYKVLFDVQTVAALQKSVGDQFSEATPPTVSLTTEAYLGLAKASGCFACHAVERNIVGPAWVTVSTKYKGDVTAKAKLVEKIKKGGKGNWTEVTGGVAMPPYSPRVADADIEKLVDFVLGLAK